MELPIRSLIEISQWDILAFLLTYWRLSLIPCLSCSISLLSNYEFLKSFNSLPFDSITPEVASVL